jgi:hypothetical protein
MDSSVVFPISSVMALMRDLSQWVRACNGSAQAAPAAARSSRLVMGALYCRADLAVWAW